MIGAGKILLESGADLREWAYTRLPWLGGDVPGILASSNPKDLAECTAEQAYTWSDGKAIYAADVQFDPVQDEGQIYRPQYQALV